MSVKAFCYGASHRIMTGLNQELGIRPTINYRPSGHNAARVMVLKLTGINPHYLPAISELRNQLTMWAGLDDKSKIRIGWSGTTILLEIPKPPSYWRQITIDMLESRRMIRRGPIATLGLGLQDDPKRINFNEAAMAHVLISGQTRSGKTNTQRLIGWNIVRNTSPDEGRLLIFDVAKRGYKWRDFSQVSHLAHPVVTDIDTADKVLAWLSNEIERRAEQHYTKPRIFCLIDELKALTDDSRVAGQYLARIASVGGEFGLHLILATQYPQVKMLGGNAELKRITTRLCGKVDDANAAANALGMPATGAELLQGYGDFLLKDFQGLSRLTVAKIDAEHVAQLPRGDTGRLDLPVSEMTHNGPASSSRPPRQECLKADEIAPILFQWETRPIGINRIQSLAGGIGSKKARRVQTFVQELIALAQANDIRTLDFSKMRPY